MFKFLARLFRRQVKDVEVKLRPTPECTYGGVGEIEIEAWSDGTASLEVSIKHSSIPDGTQVEFYSKGQLIITLTTLSGYAKQEIRSMQSASLPDVNVGDDAEIRIGGQVLYTGKFKRD